MVTIVLSDHEAEVVQGFLGELLENPADQNLPALLSAYNQITKQLETLPCEDCGRPIDEEQCPNNRGYCVDCCACPEHTEEEN